MLLACGSPTVDGTVVDGVLQAGEPARAPLRTGTIPKELAGRALPALSGVVREPMFPGDAVLPERLIRDEPVRMGDRVPVGHRLLTLSARVSGLHGRRTTLVRSGEGCAIASDVEVVHLHPRDRLGVLVPNPHVRAVLAAEAAGQLAIRPGAGDVPPCS